MKFRPCIDIHNGVVKQIVGGSLKGDGDIADENFVSAHDSAWFARMFKKDGVEGAHVVLLNSKDSKFYHASREEALKAIKAYPGGLQVGGGVNAMNAPSYIEAGASHVIVTSYVFKDGEILFDNLKALRYAVGADHVVLDLSARTLNGDYYVVTDRWQKMTDTRLSIETLDDLADFCDEFLIHAADVEGKQGGIEENVARLLGSWGKIPVTYAGGVHSIEDITRLKEIGNSKVDVTVGSALEIFGGSLSLEDVINACG